MHLPAPSGMLVLWKVEGWVDKEGDVGSGGAYLTQRPPGVLPFLSFLKQL